MKKKNENVLYHHGIKGQKWGVRRFQNKDGSLTNNGKKRYNSNVEKAKAAVSKAKRDYREVPLNEQKIAQRKIIWAKEDLKDAKLENKLRNQDTKTKRQQKLEEQYRKQGMSADEAALTAYKRIRTERALAVVGTMAVTAAVAYGAYKYRDNNIDRIIKTNTTLHRLTTNNNTGVRDAFYAAYKKSDADKYKALFGGPIKNRGNRIYSKTINVKDDGLKLASRKNASHALYEMLTRDQSFANDVADSIKDMRSNMNFLNSSEKQMVLFDKAITSLNNNKFDKAVYDAFNYNLVAHDQRQQKINDRFYSFMKSKGYDAIKDMNDTKYSGYNAKDPIIVFNTGKVAVSSVKELKESDISEAALRDGARTASKYFSMYGGIITSNVIAQKAATQIGNSRIVREYRKEHPNTKLSNKEIIRNYQTEQENNHETTNV